MRKPWDEIPGDDGYQWSLNVTRTVCAGWLLFPLLFLAGDLAIMTTGPFREEPVITAVLAVVALMTMPAAPFVRERIAQVGIGIHLQGRPEMRPHRAVYSTFATATISGFIVAQVPALFGFIASAMTRSLIPLAVGSILSYGAWAVMWPRENLWTRWTWQAKIGREDESAAPAPAQAGSLALDPDKEPSS